MTTVDYTSREFASLRNDLIQLIPQFLPEWTSRSDNDFGIVLVDLLAYVSDGLHYYADRVANEAYLASAVKRGSVLKIANLLGYTPVGNVAAAASIAFTNTGASPYTVVAGTSLETTVVENQTSLIFETDSAVTVAAGMTGTVVAHHGETITAEAVGTSTGAAEQNFALAQSPVIDGSVQVSVTTSGLTRLWRPVSHLIDASPDDEVYVVSTDENDITHIGLGDNANGQVPSAGAIITATYRVGGGVVGNVPTGTITVIRDNGVPGTISCTNPAPASGGADAETSDEIRVNAPASIQSLRRATAINDYALLAVGIPGVGRARAVSASATSVLLYISPTGGGGYDGTGAPTVRLQSLKSQTQSVVQAAAPANVSVTVLGPTYVPIDVSITVNLLPSYRQSAVTADVQVALQSLLGFDSVVFGDIITPTDIHLAVGSVPGVAYLTLANLARSGGSGTGSVALAPSEIPTVGVLTIAPVDGIPA